MQCTLFHGSQPARVFDFEDGEYLIGSAEHAHVRLGEEDAEAEHALLYITSKGVLVQNIGAATDIYVQGEKVDRMAALAPGDSVTIGEFSLVIASDTQPSPLTDDAGPNESRYEIGEIVASGAMGHVRRARELTTGREVAMKQIREEVEDEQAAARFIQEARITAHLEHPNIVPVHEVNPGGQEGRFYTMKLVQGISLQKVIELLRGRIPAVVLKYNASALLTIFQKVCDAIAFAHAKGVIHRDLKPANLMVGEYGEVLVMDWGLAKLDGEISTNFPGIAEFTDSGADATLIGTVMGTPYYMAPEQAEGQVDYVDARSDIYALGAILYELLTLFPPVDGKSAGEVLANVRAGKIIPIAQRIASSPPPHFPSGQVPASLAAVALKALTYSPERRYQTVTALQSELTAYQAGFATAAESAGLLRQLALLIRRHRTTFTLAAAALVLIASLATYFIYQLAAERDRTTEAATRAIEKEQLATRESARATEQEALAREKAKTATEEAARALASEQKAKLAQATAETALEREQTATAAASAAKTAETDAKMAAIAAKTSEEKAKQATTDAEKMRTDAELQASMAKEDADRTKNQLGAEKIKKKTEDAANGDIFEDPLGTLHYLSRVLEEAPRDSAEATLLRRKVNLALQISPRLTGVWPSKQGELERSDGSEKHRSFGFSPDGRYFAHLSEQDAIAVIDTRSQKPICPPLKHNAPVGAVAFLADGRGLLSIAGGKWWHWDLRTGKPRTAPGELDFSRRSTAFGEKESRSLASKLRLLDSQNMFILSQECQGSGGVEIWNFNDQRMLFSDPNAYFPSFAPSNGGIWLWGQSAQRDRRLVGAFFKSGFQSRESLIQKGQKFPSGFIEKISSNGERYIAKENEKQWLLGDSLSGRQVCAPFAHEGADFRIKFSQDSRYFTTLSDNKIHIRTSADGSEIASIAPADYTLGSNQTFSPNSQILATAAKDTIRLWNTTTGAKKSGIFRLASPNNPICDISPDNSQLLISWSLTALWSIMPSNTALAPKFELPTGSSLSKSYLSANGRKLLIQSDGKQCFVLDALSGKLINEEDLLIDFSAIGSISCSSDGRYFYTDYDSDRLNLKSRIWSHDKTGKMIELDERKYSGGRFVFASDSSKLVIYKNRGDGGAWLLKEPFNGPGTPIARFNATVPIFSADNTKVALSDSSDGIQFSGNVWDCTTKKPVNLAPLNGQVCALNRDGSRVALYVNGVVNILETQTGKPIGSPLPSGSNVTVEAMFSGSGKHLILFVKSKGISSPHLLWEVGAIPAKSLPFGGLRGGEIGTPNQDGSMVASVRSGISSGYELAGIPYYISITDTESGKSILSAKLPPARIGFWDGNVFEVVFDDFSRQRFDCNPDTRPVEELKKIATLLSMSQLNADGSLGVLAMSESDRLLSLWKELSSNYPSAMQLK